MSLQKNFPKQRKYYFWAILLSYLVATAPASSETDRKLFGTLAYRMISKAAGDVPGEPVRCSIEANSLHEINNCWTCLS